MTETRTVYRYENDKGEGPYRFSYTGDRHPLISMCDSHTDADHPVWLTWWGDGDFSYEEIEPEHLAACDSREALDAWFDGWQDKLEANGFRVVEYTVPAENVVDSRSGLQVAFLPVSA